MIFEQGEPNWQPDDLPRAEGAADWWGRLKVRPSEQMQVTKPKNWRRYPYPFIYGQADPKLFPVAAWRMGSPISLRPTSPNNRIPGRIR